MTSEPPIYLDYHATTPCDPRVVERMAPTFTEDFGNAASRQHAFGWRAESLVETARERVARLLGCDAREIVFTSGATESDNLAIKGALDAPSARGRHIVTCVTEHKAVLDSCHRLETLDCRVTYLPVSADGRVRVRDVAAAITDDTALVSLMYGNNEIGTIHPIAEIGALLKERGVLFHCDAAQAAPYLSCDVDRLGADLMSISAHKMYGPKGIGALYVRRRRPRVRLQPMMDGGGHERGLRSGTLNVPGIVGFGEACNIVGAEREDDARRAGKLRDLLLERITGELPDTIVNGADPREASTHRLPNNLNLTFPGVDAIRVLDATPELAVSSGSACSSASFDSSYVLQALQEPLPKEHGGIRFGVGRFTTADEVERAARQIVAAVRRLRSQPRASGDESAPSCEAHAQGRGP